MADINANTAEKRENRTLLMALLLLTIGAVVLAIIGFVFLKNRLKSSRGRPMPLLSGCQASFPAESPTFM